MSIPVVQKTPQVISYPRIESKKSSYTPGTLLFSDTYDFIQVFKNLFLIGIDPIGFSTGFLIGAFKPICDYQFKSVTPKKALAETNHEQFGQLIINDQEILEYNERHQNDGKKVDKEYLGISTLIGTNAAVVAFSAYLKNISSISQHLFVGMVALREGFSWGQRAVQWIGTKKS